MSCGLSRSATGTELADRMAMLGVQPPVLIGAIKS